MDIELTFEGHGLHEKGVDKNTGTVVVEVSPDLFRPAESHTLVGDFSKAKQTFGWEPKTTFHDLVRRMVEADFEKIKNEGTSSQ